MYKNTEFNTFTFSSSEKKICRPVDHFCAIIVPLWRCFLFRANQKPFVGGNANFFQHTSCLAFYSCSAHMTRPLLSAFRSPLDSRSQITFLRRGQTEASLRCTCRRVDVARGVGRPLGSQPAAKRQDSRSGPASSTLGPKRPRPQPAS